MAVFVALFLFYSPIILFFIAPSYAQQYADDIIQDHIVGIGMLMIAVVASFMSVPEEEYNIQIEMTLKEFLEEIFISALGIFAIEAFAFVAALQACH